MSIRQPLEPSCRLFCDGPGRITCLHDHGFSADVMPETLRKTGLGQLKVGDTVDLERAMAAEADHGDKLQPDVLDDLANHTIECTDPEWDGYEQSTLRRLADVIRIAIRGNHVEIIVSTHFA